MQEVKIQDLIVRCIEYFKEHCYTENRISKYKSLWRTGIVHFMTERSIVNYSPSIGAGFVSSCHLKGEIRHQEREKIRSVQVLDDMLLLGIIRKCCFIPVHHSLDGEVGREMEKLITHLINLRRSQVTIKDYRLCIPSFYTAEEVATVENSVSRSSSVGKRNYAMVLLASRLGLRASDIANIQFSNIDWDKDMITLIMQKTGKTIELPLLADVGNAIIDYLQHGRPQSELQNVFLSCRAPYVAATKAMVRAAINTIICKAGIDVSARHHGPHSLRNSLASTMLENGTMIPVISESLGHRNTETTLTYLRIDIKSLMQCAIPVPPVPDEFYNQRGGAFYG